MKAAILTAIILSFSTVSGAVTIYECEDSEGNRSFYDNSCPPGTTPVEEKKFRGDKEIDAPDVTLYFVPECESCTKVRNYLQARKIVFTDKNVEDNAELQKELNEKVGSLKVPTVVVDESVITGFDESAMDSIFGDEE